MKLPTQDERQWSLDVPSPTLRESNAVQKAVNNFTSATEKIFLNYLDRHNAANENEARSELNQLAQEEQFKIQSYENSEQAIRGTEMYRLDSDSKIRKKTLDQLRDKYGLSNNSYLRLQEEVNRQYDSLYNASMKSAMGFTNNYQIASFKRFNVTLQDRSLGEIFAGQDATDVFSKYSAENHRFLKENYKGAFRGPFANTITNNTRSGLVNMIKTMGDQGKEKEATIALQNILTAQEDTNPSLANLKQYLDKATITTLQRDLANNAKISAETNAKEVKNNVKISIKSAKASERSEIGQNYRISLAESWQKSGIIPRKYRSKVQNDIIESAALNETILFDTNPLNSSPTFTDQELEQVEENVMESLGMDSITPEQRLLIKNSAIQFKEQIALNNNEIKQNDTYKVLQDLHPGRNDAFYRNLIKELNLPTSVMTKNDILQAFSSSKALGVAIQDQIAKGQVAEFKMQSMRIMSMKDAKNYKTLPRTSLTIAKIDDVLGGNKEVINTKDYPHLNDKMINTLKTDFLKIDGIKKTWNKDIEPKILKNMGEVAKEFSEEISKNVPKYPMYKNMYRDLVVSRLYYYSQQESLNEVQALDMAKKDVNEYLEDTYEYVNDKIGFIVKNKNDTETVVNKGLFSDDTEHSLHVDKLEYLSEDMRVQPEKYFEIPSGFSGRPEDIKFEKGISHGEELSPLIKVNGKWYVPFKKRESKDEKLQFFRGTKGNIKKLKHNRLFDYFRNTSP
jgi:hypothetical protein